jgi:hypothetical protein
MAREARLVLQIARGGAVERSLREAPPAAVSDGDVALDTRPADDAGRLEPPAVGDVVVSVPSPETLTREPDEVRRVIDRAGTGVEPLVVVIEAADELRDDELAVVLDAADRTSRAVILRVMGDG